MYVCEASTIIAICTYFGHYRIINLFSSSTGSKLHIYSQKRTFESWHHLRINMYLLSLGPPVYTKLVYFTSDIFLNVHCLSLLAFETVFPLFSSLKNFF